MCFGNGSYANRRFDARLSFQPLLQEKVDESILDFRCLSPCHFHGEYFKIKILRCADMWQSINWIRPYMDVSGYSLDTSFGVSVVMCRSIRSDLAEAPMLLQAEIRQRFQ